MKQIQIFLPGLDEAYAAHDNPSGWRMTDDGRAFVVMGRDKAVYIYSMATVAEIRIIGAEVEEP